jgi:hypothetical protein
MEKDIGKIKKNDTTDIIVRIDEYKGKKGITVREYITSEKYTGFSKAGTRIPVEGFIEFRDIINKIDYNELMSPVTKKEDINEKPIEKIIDKEQEMTVTKKPRKSRKKSETPSETASVTEETSE